MVFFLPWVNHSKSPQGTFSVLTGNFPDKSTRIRLEEVAPQLLAVLECDDSAFWHHFWHQHNIQDCKWCNNNEVIISSDLLISSQTTAPFIEVSTQERVTHCYRQTTWHSSTALLALPFFFLFFFLQFRPPFIHLQIEGARGDVFTSSYIVYSYTVDRWHWLHIVDSLEKIPFMCMMTDCADVLESCATSG